MQTVFQTFLPNYYGSLVKGQQQALLLDNLYFYVADAVNKNATANTTPKCTFDEQTVISEVLYGGRLQPQNLVAMLRKVLWESGKVFAKYESRDPYLCDKDFYCMNSQYYIYKCIDNNKGSPSTEQPTNLVPGPFQLSDGYVWQYMYKLTQEEVEQYSIADYIPLIADPTVTAAAVRGTISTIDVINGGDYAATAKGTILEVISNNMVRIDTNSSNITGVYEDMGFYISGGLGEGQLSQIGTYIANTSGRFVTLNTPLTGVLPGSTYDIAPYISIEGSGLLASARPIMSGSRIDKIQILNRGMEYLAAEAVIHTNDSFTNTPAELQVNVSPIKGHGGDIYQELYVRDVLFTLNIDNFNIGDGTFPINEITFSKTGLLRQVIDRDTPTLYTSPAFNNTFKIQATPIFGAFAVGDKIRRSAPGLPTSGTVVYANTTHIIGTYDSPIMTFQIGDSIINQDNITGVATAVVQPDVRLLGTDIVALINIDTIKRDENMREYLQILIKVK